MIEELGVGLVPGVCCKTTPELTDGRNRNTYSLGDQQHILNICRTCITYILIVSGVAECVNEFERH